MPSSYTSNLGIELPADGELDGVWGDVVNDNMGILDRAINGTVTLTLSGTSSTLTTSDGTLSDGQYKLLVLAGSPSGTHTITIAPNDAQKIYFVRNTTTQSVVFTQGSGGSVTVPSNVSAILFTDGGGSGAVVASLIGTMASQAASNVAITGGTIDGLTDLSVTDKIIHSGDTNTAIRFPAADTVTVETSGVERMRVNSSGNVGIGVTSPNSKLQVITGTNLGGVLIGFNAGSSNFYDADLNVFRKGDGTERMRIDSAGNVGIGTTSPATPLHVNGTIRYTNRPAAGTITAIGFDSNGDLKASSSSLRYKYDIEDYEKGIADVMQLRPVKFKFNGEGITNIGFIAEEVDALGMTEVILYNEKAEPEGISYANMVSLLTKAVQEQQTLITALTARIEALENK